MRYLHGKIVVYYLPFKDKIHKNIVKYLDVSFVQQNYFSAGFYSGGALVFCFKT